MLAIAETTTNKNNDISLLDFIQKTAIIGTWEYNPNTKIVNWSDQTRRIHELPLDHIPDVETGILFYKEGYSRNTITQLFKACIENHEKFDTELQIVTGKGHEKWVRSIGIPIIENNECIMIMGLFQDVDEKTKNAIALASKEEQLRKTFNHALIGMATIDLRGNWIGVNNSLCRTSGYSEQELSNLKFQDITHPDDIEMVENAVADMIAGTIDHFETEKRYIHKNGKVIWALLSTSIIRDKNGKPSCFVAQINDLTERKKSALKVKNLLTTTENQNQRLLNFAHIVSHNLRSHYGNLDMLLDIVKMDLPETTENEIFPLIEEAVTNLGETVENLNEVASINIKRNNLTENLNLLNYLEKAIKSIAGIIIESKTIIKNDVDDNALIKGIPAYLDSILLNFLTNAIKYKKPNEHAKIHLSTSIEEEYIKFSIRDNGQGIDLNKYGDKLFGMYKTFHQHEDSRGLGLFITKNQVEAIGGKINVESEINKGTIFTISFKKAL